MKNLLWLSFGLFAVFAQAPTLQAQSPVADSLSKILLKTKQDTQRVSLLVDYAWEINESDTKLAVAWLWEAVQLAQKYKFKKGESAAWNGLGVTCEILDSLDQAVAYYARAMALRQKLGDKKGVAALHNNLGNVYELLGDYEKALIAHRESLRMVEEIGDSARIARAHLNLGNLFETMGLYPEAYEQTNAARQIFEQKSDSLSLARTYTALGHIRFELEMVAESKHWYKEALRLYERIGDKAEIANALNDLGNALDESGNADSSALAVQLYRNVVDIRKELDDQFGLANVYNNLGVAYKHLGNYQEAQKWLGQSRKIFEGLDSQPGLMMVYNSIGDVVYGQKKYAEALDYTKRYAKIADTLGSQQYILRSYKDLSKIYAAMGNFALAYEFRVKYDEYRYSRLDEARAKDFERKEALFTDGRRQREIDRQQNELEKAQTRALGLIGGALALAILAALLYNRNRIRAKANQELAAKNLAIQAERERADSLLMNILPEKTAQELKLNNNVQPVRYESVTVLFSDFKNFTQIAELLSPEELVAELDYCFRLFDHIIEEHGMEKIKTIGDAYMCAGGLPEPNTTHARDTVLAAIEMQKGLQNIMQINAQEGKPVFEMRIGIHTGPVVAGIVGSHKFAYDIWGDTVNTAARLEQCSEAGKINISRNTWELVKDEFDCEFRGKLAAKNKGEIEMYFVLPQ